MKKWKGLMALALAALLCAGCQNSTADQDNTDLLAEIQERGVLIVGTEGTYSPNSYHDESGELVGFDVEVARLIGKKLGVEVEFVEAEWDSLFASLDSGRIDTVINEVEYSEERAQKYDFSQPYTWVHGALLALEENDEIASFEDLDQKRAAQNMTSSWGQLAESYGAELVSVDTLTQCVELLISGRADATLNAETAFADYFRQHPDAPVEIKAISESTTSSLIPIPKGNDALVEAINQALDELRESGELSALSIRYFGIDVTTEERP